MSGDPWSRQGRSWCRSSVLRKAQKYVRVIGADVHEWRSVEPPGSFMVSLERVENKSKNTCVCVCSKKRPNGDQKEALLWC